jgi:hypothetical protein
VNSNVAELRALASCQTDCAPLTVGPFKGQRVRADAPLTGNEASGISSTELTSKTLDEIAYMVRGFREKKRGRLTLDTPKLLERDVEAQWNIKPRGCAA